MKKEVSRLSLTLLSDMGGSAPSSPPRSPYRYQQSDDDDYKEQERTPEGRRRRYFRASQGESSSAFPAMDAEADEEEDEKEDGTSLRGRPFHLAASMDSRGTAKGPEDWGDPQVNQQSAFFRQQARDVNEEEDEEKDKEKARRSVSIMAADLAQVRLSNDEDLSMLREERQSTASPLGGGVPFLSPERELPRGLSPPHRSPVPPPPVAVVVEASPEREVGSEEPLFEEDVAFLVPVHEYLEPVPAAAAAQAFPLVRMADSGYHCTSCKRVCHQYAVAWGAWAGE